MAALSPTTSWAATAAAYDGIPRVVFADPEIAVVGLTAAQAAARGISTATAEITLADAIARPSTYERDARGTLGLLADRGRGVLIGAWAVAPLASEWIHQAALAIGAQPIAPPAARASPARPITSDRSQQAAPAIPRT